MRSDPSGLVAADSCVGRFVLSWVAAWRRCLSTLLRLGLVRLAALLERDAVDRGAVVASEFMERHHHTPVGGGFGSFRHRADPAYSDARPEKSLLTIIIKEDIM